MVCPLFRFHLIMELVLVTRRLNPRLSRNRGTAIISQAAALTHLGRWATNVEMKIPVTVLGFGLVILGRVILGLMRASYLKQASVNVPIDNSKEIILRYAWWYYVYPLLGFGGAILTGWGVFHTKIPVAILIHEIICAFCFFGGIFLLYLQLTARVKIFEGKLTYTEASDRLEILSNEVDSVKLNGFTFIVKKRSEKIVHVPATFEHSEIILAFLNQAAVNQ